MPKPRRNLALRPGRTLKIFCEGEKTEPLYIQAYIRSFANPARKSVISVQKTRKNTPVQLVEAALEAKRHPDSLQDDQFWVVYDRESIAKYSHELHARAMDKAERGGIEVALTNVCFEYWLLLHFEDTQAPYGSFDDLIRNSQLDEMCKLTCGCDYTKSSRALFEKIKDSISDARVRATRLNQQGMQNAANDRARAFEINPYVGVVDLLDAIDNFH